MIRKKYLLWASCLIGCTLTACEHQVAMETTVHADGQLDKQITLEVDEKRKIPNVNFINTLTAQNL